MANAAAMEQSPWTNVAVNPMRASAGTSDIMGGIEGAMSGAFQGSELAKGGIGGAAPMQAGNPGSAWLDLQNRLNEDKATQTMGGDPISTQLEQQNRLQKNNLFSNYKPRV